MDRELIRDYLQQTEMKQPQAEALSRILAEMATRSALVSAEERLDGRMGSLEARLDARMISLEARLNERMVALEARFEVRMSEVEARLTWRTIAIVGFFATASTLLNAFIG